MSGEVLAGIGAISNDSETVGVRLTIELRRRVPRCGLRRSSSQQHSHLLVVTWSSSVNQTQISLNRKFGADGVVCLLSEFR